MHASWSSSGPNGSTRGSSAEPVVGHKLTVGPGRSSGVLVSGPEEFHYNGRLAPGMKTLGLHLLLPPLTLLGVAAPASANILAEIVVVPAGEGKDLAPTAVVARALVKAFNRKTLRAKLAYPMPS